jgi:hypothetical protein
VDEQGQVNRMAKDLEGYLEGLGFKTIETHLVFIHKIPYREIIDFIRQIADS